jgi:hypothetical protein
MNQYTQSKEPMNNRTKDLGKLNAKPKSKRKDYSKDRAAKRQES